LLVGENHSEHDWSVRGLRLPARLVSLLRSGRWRDPEKSALYSLLPWFEDPLVFLTSVEGMRRENRSLDLMADDEPSSRLFRVLRGGRERQSVDLPWLDVEQAVLIAVNRNSGDDVALALDYRTSTADPRVVASDFWTDPRQCAWRIVTPTFTEFVSRLGRPTRTTSGMSADLIKGSGGARLCWRRASGIGGSRSAGYSRSSRVSIRAVRTASMAPSTRTLTIALPGDRAR
jgi:hypothetical protein